MVFSGISCLILGICFVGGDILGSAFGLMPRWNLGLICVFYFAVYAPSFVWPHSLLWVSLVADGLMGRPFCASLGGMVFVWFVATAKRRILKNAPFVFVWGFFLFLNGCFFCVLQALKYALQYPLFFAPTLYSLMGVVGLYPFVTWCLRAILPRPLIDRS